MRGGAGERANPDEEGAQHGPNRAIECMRRDGRRGEKAEACSNGGASKLRRDDPAAAAREEAAGNCTKQPAHDATDHHSPRTGRVAHDRSDETTRSGQHARGEKHCYSIHCRRVDVIERSSAASGRVK